MNVFLMLFLFIKFRGSTRGAILSDKFKQINKKVISGQLTIESYSENTMLCMTKCLLKSDCKGILFNENKHISERCKIVTDGKYFIDLMLLSGLNLYGYHDAHFDVTGLTGWTSGRPKLYFPLDSDTGTKLGTRPLNNQFIAGGKIGNAYYKPYDGSFAQRAYYNLGYYPSSDYCFPEPATCNAGVSYAFWLNTLGDTTNPSDMWQGFITTMPREGPGFYVYYRHSKGMYFRIRRDSDTKREQVKIPSSTFLSNYGYNVWVHYVITYKFNQSVNINANSMKVYLNGIDRPAGEKSVLHSWAKNNTEDYNGNLEIGHHLITNSGAVGNMKMDELMIWEEELPQSDVETLYNAYL